MTFARGAVAFADCPLVPPDDRVILRPHRPEGATDFGLVLPDAAQRASRWATVWAVGAGAAYPGRPPLPPMYDDAAGELTPVVPGDVVLMPAVGGTEIDIDGERLVSILASDLLAVGDEGRCRQCGCTDSHACRGGCSWAEPDLCSSCTS